MLEEIKALENKIVKASGRERDRLIVKWCQKMIALKNAGEISEEEVGGDTVEVMFRTRSDLLDPIFDAAADMELPRETSYAQPIGHWDAKTADAIKAKEWKIYVDAVEQAAKQLTD